MPDQKLVITVTLHDHEDQLPKEHRDIIEVCLKGAVEALPIFSGLEQEVLDFNWGDDE